MYPIGIYRKSVVTGMQAALLIQVRSRLARVNPPKPDFTLRNYHSTLSRTRVAARETNSSLPV